MPAMVNKNPARNSQFIETLRSRSSGWQRTRLTNWAASLAGNAKSKTDIAKQAMATLSERCFMRSNAHKSLCKYTSEIIRRAGGKGARHAHQPSEGGSVGQLRLAADRKQGLAHEKTRRAACQSRGERERAAARQVSTDIPNPRRNNSDIPHSKLAASVA
jgi:hypothetical protein